MKIAYTLALITPLLFTAGCSYQQRHAGYTTAPSYGSSISSSRLEADQALANSVRQQFNQYGDLAPLANNIQVSANDGTITLTGTVPSDQQRKMIDAMVENTSGVTGLNDQLNVTSWPAGTSYNRSDRSDSELAERVARGLRNEPSIAPVADNVQVTADHGVIQLTGVVPRDEDRRMVERIARNTRGVVGVNDNLGVGFQPTGRTAPVSGDIFNLHVQGLSPTDRTLAQRILNGLRTDTVLAPLLPIVDINVADGRVILQGTVQTEQQKRAIVSAVQRAAGNQTVVADDLQVQFAR